MGKKRYNPDKHHLDVFKQDGVLLVDKPSGWTSFDVVNFVRSRFNIPKVGHCGTLDPAATGLLVLMLGKFTRLSDRFSAEDKTYEATMLLGTETDSQDMEGNVTGEKDCSDLTEAQVKDAVNAFTGVQMQTPPMVSAVKKDGKRLYELARKGIEVEREPREINIYSIDITRVELPQVDFTVKCSKGTYVRTLCADIGAKLGCGGCLFNLRRTRSGGFSLDDALDIETLKSFEQPELMVHVRKFLFEKVAKLSMNEEF